MPLPPMPSEMGTIISDIDSLAKASESSLRSNQKETVQSSKAATKKKSVSETRTSASANKATRTKETTAKKSKISRSNITKATTKTPISDSPAILQPQEKPKVKPTGLRQRYKGKKLFILDTNVLMHDPLSLFQFQEHDVFLPMITLEELDGHKKGLSDVARNARQVSRYLDQLLAHTAGQITEGIELNALGHMDATGKLFSKRTLLMANYQPHCHKEKPTIKF